MMAKKNLKSPCAERLLGRNKWSKWQAVMILTHEEGSIRLQINCGDMNSGDIDSETHRYFV
jgi:hypothetical protein